MDAYDFSKPTRDAAGTSYHFGVDNSNVADTLREIADKLDRQEIAVQSCKVLSTASREEFSYTVLRIGFSEKREDKVATRQLSFYDQFNSVAPYLGEVKKPADDFIENIEYAKKLLAEMHLDEENPKQRKLKMLYGEHEFPVATRIVK